MNWLLIFWISVCIGLYVFWHIAKSEQLDKEGQEGDD